MRKTTLRAIGSAILAALCLPLLANTQADTVNPLTKDVKTSTITELIKEMKSTYFFTDLSPKVEQDLTARKTAGEYDSITDPQEFAKKLTADMNAICHDAHLRVRYSKNILPTRAKNEEPSAAEIKAEKRWGTLMNGGFMKAERLDGNVGYINLEGFIQREQFEKPAQAAMAFVANTDALILDLRHNGGGDPDSVRYLCSYFFDKKTHLNDLEMRGQGTQQFWTVKVPGPSFANKPIYVLTSKRTGSGAEECAYDIQSLHRGPIIGESTWGGANPGGMVRLNDHFCVFIPQGRAVNPYTHANWEGAGVQPDVKIAADDALHAAQLMAVKDLLAKATEPDDKARLTDILDSLQPKP
jgi:hypothetical protein